MKEAMEQVKNELGRDAVILHTKKYREGGFLGYRSKEVVEVTAALEEEEKVKKKSSGKKGKKKDTEAPPLPVTPVFPSSVLNQYKTSGTEAGVELAEQGSPPFGQTRQPPVKTPALKPPAFPDFNSAGSRVIKAEAFQPAAEAVAGIPGTAPGAPNLMPPVTAVSSPEDAAKIQRLEDELAQMKSVLAQYMRKDQPENMVSLQEALLHQEVCDAVLADMAAKSGVGETLVDCRTEEAKATLATYLNKVMKFSDGIKLNKHGIRIAALIGATGVGKTTTLAKIAARFVLEKGIKAALVTADTYRISAVEQLKTYSDIIGVPLDIVYTPQELRRAIIKHKDKDLILVDTAGRSQHNDFQMKELREFLEVDNHMERHLVLSATTKERDAASIIEKFSACNPNHIIFTKTDETSSLGMILNLLRDKNISLSYLTNGQSVPDDILPASSEMLADILLRDKL